MLKISNYLQEVGSELLIIFLFIFLLNNFVGKPESKINGDGIGYYDYLPSLFIHSDFVRNEKSIVKDSIFYKRINSLNIYNDYRDKKLNKYPCGTAILQSPFFLFTYFTKAINNKFLSGYEQPFQKVIFFAAIFYLFFGVYYLKKLLEIYNIDKLIITFIQLLVVLGTSLVHYTNGDPAYSHVYSFFAISIFLYYSKLFFLHKHVNYFLIACLCLGLIILLRQINVVIIGFIPFLSGSFATLSNSVKSIFQKRVVLFSGILILSAIISIQCLVWYFQIGDFIVYSYLDEGFNFFSPAYFNILFSYQKGLFIYTPFLFIATLCVFWLLYKNEYFLFFTWLTFFGMLTYLLSSWWCWFYGASFGLRAYIEFYAIFCVPFAICLNEIPRIMKFVLIFISSLTIPINVIQAYQYKEFILHWVLMDKTKYWNVFLKTDNKFKGFVWKENKDIFQYRVEDIIHLGNKSFTNHSSSDIVRISSKSIKNFNKVSLIEVSMENDFNEKNNGKLILGILEDKKKFNYWHEVYLIHFAEKGFNVPQKGKYDFEIKSFVPNKNQEILVNVQAKDEPIHLKNITIKFLSLR